MRQMLLDWGPTQPQTLGSFVPGGNQELVQRLNDLHASLLGSGARRLDERFIYLWGGHGSGKTHLLRSLAVLEKTRYVIAGSGPEAFSYSGDTALYLIDDCDKLAADEQIAVFALYNQVREHDGLLIAAGSVAPAVLQVREDLRTRLGWGLIYQVHGLTDEEKIDALTRTAQTRGLALSPGVIPYLITHHERDMRSLAAMLDALDRYSLETKRPVTLPLLRELLQLEAEPKT